MHEEMIVLLDESGTPSIKHDSRTEWFIEVGVTYSQSEEDNILSSCESVCGLAKRSALKNCRLSNSRAIEIARSLTQLKVLIEISSVKTTDIQLRKTITDYEAFAGSARVRFRGARKLPIAQIMHSQLFDHCLFHLILKHFESGGDNAEFQVFMDDWAIPQDDVEIQTILRSTSLQQQIAPLCRDYHSGQLISISTIHLLRRQTQDSRELRRKKFIDALTSTVSRAFLNKGDNRFTFEPLRIIQDSGLASSEDATPHLIKLMRESIRANMPIVSPYL